MERTRAMASAFVGFLSDMNSRQINHLYQSPWACLSVLRSLPPLAKHYVMRLIYVDVGIAREEIDAWVRPGKEHKDRHGRAMEALKRLRVLVPAGDQEYVADGKELVRLNRRFAKGMRAQLETCFNPEGDDAEGTVSPSDTMGGNRPTPKKIDEFAKSRWESLLLTLTGRKVDEFDLDRELEHEPNAKRRKGHAPLDVASLFRGAGLIAERSSKDKGWGITEKGFKFLLTTAREQIWTLLTEYVREYVDAVGAIEQKVAEVSIAGTHRDIGDAASDDDDDDDDKKDADIDVDDMDKELVAPAVVGFMLRLTFQNTGAPYRSDDLPQAQRSIVADLAHLGLLYLFTGPGGKGYYVPPPLTAGLSGGGEKDGEGGDESADGGAGKQTSTSDAIHDVGDAGHIIVETNYRVYAYTFSDVECEILRLFTRPDYRLPNLYVGMLTREAVHDALDTGKFIFILVWAIRLTACFVHRRRRGADNQIPPSARAPKLASRHEGRRDSPERRGPDHAVGVGA